jgi:hypothetical protein
VRSEEYIDVLLRYRIMWPEDFDSCYLQLRLKIVKSEAASVYNLS